MPFLEDFQTDLKSLRYGNDRLGAGMSEGSGQPYIRRPIPEGSINSGLGDEDFLLRGGSLFPGALARDVSRVTKYLTDTKSINGILFSLKQEVLSRSAVNVKAKLDIGSNSNSLPLNNGVYLPTSTIAQTAVQGIGGHLLKQGINPAFDTSEAAARGNPGGILSFLTGNSLPLSNPIYFETDAFKERITTDQISSRLVEFSNQFISNNRDDTVLYSYSGGPGSVVGVGSTEIMLSTQRTGVNNPFLAGTPDKTQQFLSTTIPQGAQLQNPASPSPTSFAGFISNILNTNALQNNFQSFQQAPVIQGFYDYSVFRRPTPTWQGSKIFNGKSLSQIYQTLTNLSLEVVANSNFYVTSNVFDNSNGKLFSTSVFQNGLASNSPNVRGLDSTLNYSQLQESLPNHSDGGNNNVYDTPTIKQDFRTKTNSGNSVKSIDYTGDKTFENRVFLGNPGKKNTSRSYVTGNEGALDRLNVIPLYKSNIGGVSKKDEANDFVKFRIGVIDNDNPENKTYMHFRAIIDQMDDNYNAEWTEQKFMGRAEKFYNYGGFDRTLNLAWTVVAQSKQELMPMYRKLNYLASVCAPDYSSDGYMRGNLITLTLGGWFYETTGIMQSISYTVPEESPWEIAINENGGSDSTVEEMPHIIRVTGFVFKPIERFVPSLQRNKYGTLEATTEGAIANDKGTGDVVQFGPQRYIKLAHGIGPQYSQYGEEFAPNAITDLNDQIQEEADAAEEEARLAEAEEFLAETAAAERAAALADVNSELNQTAVTNINNVLRNVPGFNTGA